MDENAIDVLQREHSALQELFTRVSSPDEDRPAVLKDIMQTMAAHLDMEQQVLVPVMRDRLEDGGTAADQLDDEHQRVQEILTLLERRKVNSPDVPDLVTQLLDINDEHVASAESTVVPGLRVALDESELARLGAEMTSDERRALTHAHPKVPTSGPLAGAARKVAELVDRARDSSADVNRTNS